METKNLELIMPANYVDVFQEEMFYIDGGIHIKEESLDQLSITLPAMTIGAIFGAVLRDCMLREQSLWNSGMALVAGYSAVVYVVLSKLINILGHAFFDVYTADKDEGSK